MGEENTADEQTTDSAEEEETTAGTGEDQLTTGAVLAGAIALLLWAIYSALPKPLPVTPYEIMGLMSFIILAASAAYIHRLRERLDEMHGMMAGMTFGMAASMIAGTLYVIPTGDFLMGMIIGTAAGLIFGVPFGALGGPLGIMEGIMAGSMGGMMGAMLGQMIRPYDIDLFMPFFTALILITLAGTTYAVNRRWNCSCEKEEQKTKVSSQFTAYWAVGGAIALLISIMLPFSIDTGIAGTEIPTNIITQKNDSLRLPPYLQELTKENTQQAALVGDHQEANITITASKYIPNTILAKKGIPLKLNYRADLNSGCAREVIFPDLKIDRIVPKGGVETIVIDTTNAGTFKFRCSMDMVRGKVVVE